MSNDTLLVWSSACETHPGKVRKVNEDACLNLPELGLWAVADGMGGHEAGDVASQLIVEQLRNIREPSDIHGFIAEVKVCLTEANRQLREMASQRYHDRTIGSTIVAMAAFGNQCAFIWVGDSRIYRLRNGKLERVTKDHSMIEDYIDQGLLPPEGAEASEIANVLTRAVGAEDELDVECKIATLCGDDVYLLCSDGLYREVTDSQIIQGMAMDNCADSAKRVLELALENKARDNITVSVIQIKNAFA